MKRFMHTLLGVSIIAMVPVIASAAGTYYQGNLYQNPQRYGTNRGGYYNTYGAGAGRGYDQGMQSTQAQAMQTMGTRKYGDQQSKKSARDMTKKQGLELGVNFTHEFANWDFEMKEAGSNLRYDNLTWNVISGEGAYYFDTSTPMQIKFGARYGKQFGETSMIDDDISNGAYAYIDYDEGRLSGYAMSVGTSEGGTQFGFNAAFGLTDFFSMGPVKVTPSIGYRYFKHELTTKNNHGLTMDVFMSNATQDFVNCISVNGETQCDPLVGIGFYNSGNTLISYNVVGRYEEDGSLSDIVTSVPSGTSTIIIDLGDSYYYSQSGTSHKYETTWAGPYVALDMEYAINNNNLVNAGIELGLPIYTSEGDQPYRIDWQHPKSVEDKGSLGDAYHLGLNALWSTAISDGVMFSLGMTYDFYKVNGATAKTYLNGAYYQPILESYQEQYDEYAETIAGGATLTEAQQADYLELGKQIALFNSYKSAGWTIESKDEIKSIYKSMGIRAGLSVKF